MIFMSPVVRVSLISNAAKALSYEQDSAYYPVKRVGAAPVVML